MLASQKFTYSVLSWVTKTVFAGFPAKAGWAGSLPVLEHIPLEQAHANVACKPDRSPRHGSPLVSGTRLLPPDNFDIGYVFFISPLSWPRPVQIPDPAVNPTVRLSHTVRIPTWLRTFFRSIRPDELAKEVWPQRQNRPNHPDFGSGRSSNFPRS